MTFVRFSGTVVQKSTTSPLAGVTVEAFDLSKKVTGAVAKTRTDEDGRFVVELTEELLDRLVAGGRATLFFRVRSGNQVIASTERTLTWSTATSSSGVIEVATGAPRFAVPSVDTKYVVSGRVAKAATGPVANATVKVFRRTLNVAGFTEALVATTTTGADGRFAATFAVTGERPSLRVEASLASVVFASRVVDGAGPREVVDLADDDASVARSTFDRLRRAVEPHSLLLTEPPVEIDWTPEQTAAVAKASEQPRSVVDRFVQAKALFDAAGGKRETYFGLLAKGLPTTPGRFFARGRSSFRAALEQAIADGDIQRGVDVEAELNALESAAAEQLMLTTHPDIVPIGAVVSLTSGETLTEAVRKQFVRLVIRNDGTRDATWTAVAGDATTAAHVNELKTRVGLGQLSADHRPMLTALRLASGVTTEKDVAKLTRAQIRTMVDAITPPYPPGTEGATEAAKRDAYAKEVADRIEKKFRTEFHKKTFGVATPEATFFTSNATFDFKKTRVARYLAENPTALDAIAAPDRPAVVARLKEEERLFHFTDYSHEVVALRAAGIKSAHAVHRFGRGRFKTRMNASGFSDAALDVMYDRAVQRSAAGHVALGRYGIEMSSESLSGGLSALPKGGLYGSITPPKLADWPSLFGSLDTCRCEPCNSVLSPAAYLVDLLQFLHRVDATGPDDGHDRFLERRPDVQYILLDCPSSLTPMPLIDLAIEIIEVRIALIADAAAFPDEWPTKKVGTTGDAEELLAMPDPVYNQGSSPSAFLRNKAYTYLRGRRYPFDAPYNLWSDEVATYLAALGVPRHELCRILAPSTTPAGDLTASVLETTWRLGLSRGAYRIINGDDDTLPHELWGLPAAIAYPGALRPVPSFLLRSGLSYDELRELVATKWAEGEGVEIVGDGCKLEELEVDGLDTGNLRYLHRLLRLRLRTKLSITDIDKARSSLLNTIDDASLRAFALAVALHDSLDVPWTTALSWWGNVDTWSAWTPSTFDKLFLDKSARNPNDEDFEALLGTPPADPPSLQEVIPGLLIGTRLREQDLRLLLPVDDSAAPFATATIESLALPAVLHSRQTLTLANVSRLLRHATFARALGMPLAELLLLRALSGSKPLAGDVLHVGPASTFAFVELRDRVRSGPLSVADIDYVLRDRPYPGLRPDDTQPWIEEIVAALARIHAVAMALEDATGDRTRALLEELFPTDAVAVSRVMAAIDQSLPPPTPPATWESHIRAYLAPFVEDVDATVIVLFGDTAATPDIEREPLGERFAHVARRLERYVVARAFVITWAAQTFAIPVDIVKFLLEQRLKWLPHGAAPPAVAAMRALLPGNDVLATVPAPLDTDASRPAALTRSAEDATKVDQILRRLHKAALLVNRLRLDLAQVELLFRANDIGELPLLDLDALRVTPATATDPMPTSAFASLLDIIDLAALGGRFAGGPATLATFLRGLTVGKKPPPTAPTLTIQYPFPKPNDPKLPPGPAPDLADALNELADAGGWQREDVALLAARFGVTTRARLCDVDVLVRIERAMATLATLGARASAAIDWVAVTTAGLLDIETPRRAWSEERNARAVIRLARAKYPDDATWSAVAKPLRNGIRERQKGALVAALLDHLGMTKPADLYAHLLIDVEVTAAPMTSRIVQASAAIQQYVQRALLQLEPGVTLDEGAASTWKWMKSYRIWEANRKVFLYPENYLVPELRDDKTPLFEDLETFLLQGPITHARAEEAYLRYLAGLEAIANLRPVAIHKEDGGTVHLIGASPDPRAYYYRTRRAGRWSPWERMDLDIEGEHVALTCSLGRPVVLWMSIEVVNLPNTNVYSGQPAVTQNRVRLHWSAYQDSRWCRKATAEPWSLGLRTFGRYHRLSVSEVDDGRLQAIASVHVSGNTYYIHNAVWDVDVGRASAARVAQWGTMQTRGRNMLDDDGIKEVIPNAPDSEQPGDVGDDFDRSPVNLEPWGQHQVAGLAGSPAKTRLLAESDGVNREVFAQLAWTRFATTRPAWLMSERRDVRVLAHRDMARSLLVEVPALDLGDLGVADPPVGFGGAGELSVRGRESSGPTPTGRATLLSHPFAARFRDAVVQSGLDGLLRWNNAAPIQRDFVEIDWMYEPAQETFNPNIPFPKEDVDFRAFSTFGVYNWELFFHIPMMMATRLAAARRHEEAMRWFHYMFEPTDGSSAPAPARYWKVKPFFELQDFDDIAEELQDLAEGAYSGNQSIDELLSMIDSDAEGSRAIGAQIDEWIADPFDPFAIARLRHLAYMKWVVQAYIQNLLDWGDQLFSQDTLETVNEATQLYVHALNLLGPRPVTIEPPSAPARKTYKDLEADLDDFGNGLVGSETSGGWQTAKPLYPQLVRDGESLASIDSVWRRLYFCIPPNEKLIGMWDLVEDRLFKIRRSLNIEGVARTLPLFAPPIDPALLVAATAAGLDLSAVVADLNAAAPHYRFNVLLAKAGEFTSAVVSLGQSLLSAMEKRDAEELALLRQTHEIAIHQATLTVRKEQIKETVASLEALRQSKVPVQSRLSWYEGRKEVYQDEETALKTAQRGQAKIQTAGDFNLGAKAATAVPDIVAGSAGLGPAAWAQYGGSLLSAALGMLALDAEQAGSRLVAESGNLSTRAGYRRRHEDYQRESAALKEELVSIDKQIVAAEIRLAIAEHEQAVIEKQIEQSRQVNDVLKTKFTNKQLYDWMVSQVSAVYFQAYQLAYDMARKAERAFQLERGDDEQRFIRFGAWDGVHQGLLAGERLSQDLRSLDAAYIAQNRREYELTKNLPLAQHDPEQLLWLRETGEASFTITEADYDRDHPTHYLRRLKAVAVSIPCVTGPGQGVPGQLTLFRGQTRVRPTDAGLKDYTGVVQNIVTSSGQNDAGLFETNLKDERLLPFEGVGAHAEPATQAQWRYKVSPGADFDRHSIDDLILHLRYTARDGRLTGDANVATRWRMFRLRTAFADAWNAHREGDVNEITFGLDKSHFPAPPGAALEVKTVKLVSNTPAPGGTYAPALAAGALSLSLAPEAPIGTLERFGSGALSSPLPTTTETWTVTFPGWTGARSSLTDIWILVAYAKP